ncbi:MAG: GTP 3',8-cyclase MoaA [Planctomycetota bacterium]|nr:MAG: GTP 3',8-cyclase MoaA [Planctomycetota bacterium]
MVELTPRAADAPRPSGPTGELIDGCGRRIDHLRLSVTSRCDLRCCYCLPRGGHTRPRDPLLTDRQRVEFVAFLHERYGLSKVRITGGEPLVYRNTVALVSALKRTVPKVELAMTTNARLLYHHGFDLLRAGLDRVNVSLDSLDPVRYRRLTGGVLEPVLEGIRSALFLGFPPPRINTVVLRDLNDKEIVSLAEWALEQGLEIRFLEVMPIGPAAEHNRRHFVPAADIRSRLEERFDLTPLPREHGETASRFRARSRRTGRSGVVGVIAPVTEPFCGQCRRIRLTAEGRLYPCLLDSRFADMRDAWKGGRFDPAVAADLLERAVAGKAPQGGRQFVTMSTLGG